MKIITKVLPANHNLFLFGDDHEGTILRHKKGWDQLVNMMNSEYAGVSANFGVDHGDIIEAIMTDDPRYDPETTETSIPMEQQARAIENRKEIADKLLVILEGNHPRKLWRFGAITKTVCRKLNVPYGTWSAKLIFRDRKDRLLYKSFHTHGRKTITSTADDPKRRIVNMRLILKRHLKFKMGDCALMSKGHTHKLIVCEPESELYITDNGSKTKQSYTMQGTSHTEGFIHPDHRWYVNAGSFLRLYGEDVSGYAEIGEYDPIELGFAVARKRNRKIQGIDKVILK